MAHIADTLELHHHTRSEEGHDQDGREHLYLYKTKINVNIEKKAS